MKFIKKLLPRGLKNKIKSLTGANFITGQNLAIDGGRSLGLKGD